MTVGSKLKAVRLEHRSEFINIPRIRNRTWHRTQNCYQRGNIDLPSSSLARITGQDQCIIRRRFSQPKNIVKKRQGLVRIVPPRTFG